MCLRCVVCGEIFKCISHNTAFPWIAILAAGNDGSWYFDMEWLHEWDVRVIRCRVSWHSLECKEHPLYKVKQL